MYVRKSFEFHFHVLTVYIIRKIKKWGVLLAFCCARLTCGIIFDDIDHI